MKLNVLAIAAAVVLVSAVGAAAHAGETRVNLAPDMVTNEAERGNPEAMVDEQDAIGDPPSGKPESTWTVESQFSKSFPYSAYIDLGTSRNLSSLWLYDTYNVGTMIVSTGEPHKWQEVARHRTEKYQAWARVSLDVSTRYLRITRQEPSCIFAEIALYEHTPESWAALQNRNAALRRAEEEAANRPLVDVGPPFGRLPLVDEIDCTLETPGHEFRESPAGASRVETILGRRCRVLRKTEGEAAYFAFRIGKWKLLNPGAAYVLSVEYPEDASRSTIVFNGGNETIRGFHTGQTFGDAFHPKYVSNNNESLRVPLAGEYRAWRMFFYLHDRFPELEFIRGAGRRALSAEDGFPVVIAQFSAANDPASHGAAVSRIRLFEVPQPSQLDLKLRLPPPELPRRHIFWREEMADGVVAGNAEEERGLKDPIDWYRFKARTMRFLGINTYTKDLLEFGACQHWDSGPGGGNDWVFHDWHQKGRWAEIVELMGREGFDLLPYYEYSGSKGSHGLGNQRRAKPLTRDDAYTHISWIESANADLTDPDTYDDFRKMLDLTIVQYKDKARFLGAWLRPRSQLPIGFGDATRERFAKEANGGKLVSRRELIDDKTLLGRYCDWWYGKRREFLAAMRDHLRRAGVNPEAVVLFTADPSEPGVSFPTWEKRFVTDDVAFWQEMVARPEVALGKELVPIGIDRVVREDLFLEALLAPRLNWGGWEVDHSSPPADPNRYGDVEGVLLTHGFNRAYTAASPRTFARFRGPSGLAMVRHYALNENMLFDREDQPKLGYVVADFERAGPYCMLAEARAMAHGDPTHLGYLVGGNFARGFPEYVRAFNAAFLALPALPSEVVAGAASNGAVVVRSIDTPGHGTYLSVVNTGLTEANDVVIELPTRGRVTDAATGQALAEAGNRVTLSFYPCQLRALWVE